MITAEVGLRCGVESGRVMESFPEEITPGGPCQKEPGFSGEMTGPGVKQGKVRRGVRA